LYIPAFALPFFVQISKKMVLFSKKVAFREGEKCEKMALGEVEV
jgi:hypothetical protein